MNQLIPCPGCSRHVRKSESSCPFCSTALALADLPEPQLPRTRLGRAATFAFGATLASATALAGCSSDSDDGKEGGGGTTSKAGNASGGSSAGNATGGGGSGTVGPVYGAPAAGTGGDVSSGGDAAMGGGAMALYGAPPMGGGQNGAAGSATAGTGAFPVYGAAPADK